MKYIGTAFVVLLYYGIRVKEKQTCCKQTIFRVIFFYSGFALKCISLHYRIIQYAVRSAYIVRTATLTRNAPLPRKKINK